MFDGSGGGYSGVGMGASHMSHSFTRRASSSSRVSAWERRVSVAQVAAGVSLALVAARTTYASTALTGTVLGAVMCAAGLAGYVGGRLHSVRWANAHLLACVFALMLSLSFAGGVLRATAVDCGLASLHLKAQQLEGELAAARAGDALASVYARLNSMEDALGGVQVAAQARAAVSQAEEKARGGDLAYIEARLEVLRTLASSVSKSVQDLNQTVPVQGGAEQAQGGAEAGQAQGGAEAGQAQQTTTHYQYLTDAQRSVVQQRLRAAERVLERIKRHRGAPAEGDASLAADAVQREPISFEEYRLLLEVLADPEALPDMAQHSGLQASIQELPQMAAAFQRASTAGAYRVGAAAEATRALEDWEHRRGEERRAWEVEFAAAVARSHGRGEESFADQIAHHCLVERRGERWALAAAAVALCVQLASAYVALCLTQSLPRKVE